MKQILACTLIIVFNSTLWGTTIYVGVNIDKIVILEYWKFENGIETNEVVIYNPTEEEISIEFKKYNYKKQNWLKRLFTRNTLLKVKKLESGDYFIYEKFRSNVMNKSNGTVEVVINDIEIGLYGISRNSKKPISKLQNGIVVNQQINNGRNLIYEMVYNQLNFNSAKTLNVEIKFNDPKFQKMGFPLSKNNNEYYNDDKIEFEIIEASNLNVEKEESFKFIISYKDHPGSIKLVLSNNKSNKRISQYYCYFKTTNGEGYKRLFTPNFVKFNDHSKYLRN